MSALDLASVHRCSCIECQLHPFGSLAQEHRLLNQFLATVDERSRRLFAAFLVIHYGRGGLTNVARITGLSRMTLRRGRHELLEPERTAPNRIRRKGGGRKRLEKKRPRSPERLGATDAGCHGGRSDEGVEVDT